MATDPRDPRGPQVPKKEPAPPEPPEPFSPDLELITYIERGQGPKADNR